jgi:hypothetical protein
MIHIIQPRATSEHPERQMEYDHVAQVNASRFARISTPDTRSFMALFDLCDPRYINVIANADIIIENSVHLHSIEDGEAWVLSRWEDGILYDHRDSQDVWVVRGRPPQEFINALNFNMGVPGCDNRLAWELQQFYKVSNPSKTIRCHHHHASGIRSYGKGRGQVKKEVVPPPYLLVEPSRL